MRAGLLSRSLTEEVRLELRWRFDMKKKYTDQLERFRAQRKFWLGRRFERWPSHPAVVTAHGVPGDVDVNSSTVFANPYKVRSNLKRNHEIAAMKYRFYLFGNRELLQHAIDSLNSKHLICSEGLHGNVLLDVVNRLTSAVPKVPPWVPRHIGQGLQAA
jgi:hypothetical protein